MSVPTAVARATFVSPLSGVPQAGYVQFKLNSAIADSSGDTIVLDEVVRVDLDEDGHIEVELVLTEFEGSTPDGVAYRVSFFIEGVYPYGFWMTLGPEMEGLTFELSDIVPMEGEPELVWTPPESVAGAPGPQGPPGSQGPQGPPGNSSSPNRRWYGEGPPSVVVGASLGDEYVDSLTGNLYILR